MAQQLSRMLYVDDSGHPQSGLVVFGWIEFAPDHLAGILKSWLDMRKRLWREFGIPVTRELHTTEYVNGRGRISKRVPSQHVRNGVELWKEFGREVAVQCLDTLRSTEGIAVGAVYRSGPPNDSHQIKRDAYAALVERFETECDREQSLALVFMDGDGTESHFRTTHRGLKLSRRRVIEDAIHLESKHSQLMQMADLVAWSANAAIDRYPANEFAWGWYERYLSERDRLREPQRI